MNGTDSLAITLPLWTNAGGPDSFGFLWDEPDVYE